MERESVRLRVALALIAAVALGYALQPNNGALGPQAVPPLNVAVVAALFALIAGQFALHHRAVWHVFAVAVAAGLTFQLYVLLTSSPGIYLRRTGPDFLHPFVGGIAVAAVLIGAGFTRSSWLGRARMPLLLLTYFCLGLWIIPASPDPWIDVYLFQRESSLELLSGRNPYALTFVDIYGGNPMFYGKGLSINGRLQFGFPYPPLSLLPLLPAQLLFSDVRYVHLACIVATGGFIAYARPGWIAETAAAVFLFTPRSFFVLEQSWTEPLVLLGLSGTVFTACRAPRALPYVLGLFLVSKQYLVMLAPAVVFLLQRPLLSRANAVFIAKAAITGLVVTLPLALWDVAAFMRSVVFLQTYQPFRPDSLSYLAIWAQRGRGVPSTAIAFILPIVTYIPAFWRGGRGVNGFATTSAVVMFLFFAFNKQAFCNYYFFVVGALCLAAAVSAGEPTPHTQPAAAPTVEAASPVVAA